MKLFGYPIKELGLRKYYPALLFVIIIFITLPIFFVLGAFKGFLAFAFITFALLLLKLPGVPYILIAIATCFPRVMFGYGENANLPEFTSRTTMILKTLMLIITLIILFNFKAVIKKMKVRYVLIAIFFFLLQLLYGVSFQTALFSISFGILAYFACGVEKNDLRITFLFFSIIFLGHSIYAIIDYYFDVSPYSVYYLLSQSMWSYSDGIHHASGIVGDYLYFSLIVGCYQALLLIELYYNNKLHIFMQALCIFTAMLLASRTSIAILAVEWAVFFLIDKKFVKSKNFKYVVLIVLLAIVCVIPYMSEIMEGISDKFNGENDHRMAAFPSTLNLFVHNPLGVGPGNVGKAMRTYGTSGLITDFTLDNYFLQSIASYGLLAIISFLYYFIYMIESIRTRRFQKNKYGVTMILSLSWCALCFSFSVFSHPNGAIIYLGILSLLQSGVTEDVKLSV